MSDPRDLQQYVPDYSYVKEQFRLIQPLHGPVGDPSGFQNGFSGLRFHLTPLTRVELTWKQRWSALNQWEWRQFWTGVRFDIHTCASSKCGEIVASRYAPGREVSGE